MNVVNGKTNMRFFHLSEKEVGGAIFYPRIPDNTLTITGNEDNTIERVCFSPSVEQCLLAMCNGFGDYNVYEPENYAHLKIIEDTQKMVPDFSYTKEIWSLTPVKMKKIGSINVFGYPDWEGKFILQNKVNNRYFGEVMSWYWENV